MCIKGAPSNKFDLAPSQGILAWRKWDVRDGALRPTFWQQENAWTTKLAKSHARPNGRRNSDIGLHALGKAPQEHGGTLVGKVRLFGRVVEHKRDGKVSGYLAEYAEIVSFSEKRSVLDPTHVRGLARKYGVKVVEPVTPA